jgi:hypothetical protein
VVRLDHGRAAAAAEPLRLQLLVEAAGDDLRAADASPIVSAYWTGSAGPPLGFGGSWPSSMMSTEPCRPSES